MSFWIQLAKFFITLKCILQQDYELLQVKLACKSQKANKSSSFIPLNSLHSFPLKQNKKNP